jgi:6-pyruvoyltetrahydropterin/6-carboxytetrahydropterin synthase
MHKFMELQELGLAEIVVMDGVGAEKFAEHAFNFANKLVKSISDNRCYCVKVECAEHGANSAIYEARRSLLET